MNFVCKIFDSAQIRFVDTDGCLVLIKNFNVSLLKFIWNIDYLFVQYHHGKNVFFITLGNFCSMFEIMEATVSLFNGTHCSDSDSSTPSI
jgi:hypothetical protein